MISIIVPVYNVEAYLPRCLESLTGQTCRDLEIICVNDGSTDGSLRILQDAAAKDGRIRVVDQKNQGLSGARNSGLQVARGEWVMFVDSDDWIDCECCASVLAAVTPETDLCFFSYVREFPRSSEPKYIFDTTKRIYRGTDAEQLYVRLIAPTGKELGTPDKLDSLSTAWGKLYKTSIIKEHQIEFVSTKEIGTEDLLFNVYYFTWIKEAVYLPNPFYHYRKNNITSLTKLYKPQLTQQWQRLFKYIEDWIKPLQRSGLEEALDYRRALSLIGQGLNITFSPDGLRSQYRALSRLLHSSDYRRCIQKLPMGYFPLHWKVFYRSARCQCTPIVLCLLKIMKRIIEK